MFVSTSASRTALRISASLIACLALVALVGCAGEAPEATPDVAAPAADGSMTVGGLTLTPLPDSPKFADAKVELHGIEPGQNLEEGTIGMHFGVEGYELGIQTSDAADKGLANSAQGQHIHLILNNGPYSAHYDGAVETDLSPGYYVMLAFLSRSYHESLKNPGAAVLTDFTVGGAQSADVDLSAPHLFYSRPKGTYGAGDIDPLMLDFYLVNTDLSADGNRVRATINGNEFVLTDWVPYQISGLEPGVTTIQLELLDAQGNLVPGQFNRVTRTVTLEGPEPATEATEG